MYLIGAKCFPNEDIVFVLKQERENSKSQTPFIKFCD